MLKNYSKNKFSNGDRWRKVSRHVVEKKAVIVVEMGLQQSWIFLREEITT